MSCQRGSAGIFCFSTTLHTFFFVDLYVFPARFFRYLVSNTFPSLHHSQSSIPPSKRCDYAIHVFSLPLHCCPGRRFVPLYLFFPRPTQQPRCCAIDPYIFQFDLSFFCLFCSPLCLSVSVSVRVFPQVIPPEQTVSMLLGSIFPLSLCLFFSVSPSFPVRLARENSLPRICECLVARDFQQPFRLSNVPPSHFLRHPSHTVFKQHHPSPPFLYFRFTIFSSSGLPF